MRNKLLFKAVSALQDAAVSTERIASKIENTEDQTRLLEIRNKFLDVAAKLISTLGGGMEELQQVQDAAQLMEKVLGKKAEYETNIFKCKSDFESSWNESSSPIEKILRCALFARCLAKG